MDSGGRASCRRCRRVRLGTTLRRQDDRTSGAVSTSVEGSVKLEEEGEEERTNKAKQNKTHQKLLDEIATSTTTHSLCIAGLRAATLRLIMKRIVGNRCFWGSCVMLKKFSCVVFVPCKVGHRSSCTHWSSLTPIASLRSGSNRANMPWQLFAPTVKLADHRDTCPTPCCARERLTVCPVGTGLRRTANSAELRRFRAEMTFRLKSMSFCCSVRGSLRLLTLYIEVGC